jgi:hypothetical protein
LPDLAQRLVEGVVALVWNANARTCDLYRLRLGVVSFQHVAENGCTYAL